MSGAIRWLSELARVPAPIEAIGGKAANLARLIGAGLAVPDGFVISAGARRASSEAAVIDAAREAAAAWPDPLVVRSSSPLEDAGEAAAPGVFSSRVGVVPDALADAIRSVWASAAQPVARAYGAARGLSDPVELAVVIQPRVEGERVVIYTRAPDADADEDRALVEVERGGAIVAAHVQASDGRLLDLDSPLTHEADRLRELVAAARAAADAIEAPRGADVELISGDRVWIVQARPITGRGGAARTPPPILFAFSRGDAATTWRWDVTHNPDPLSPAQAGLVEHVEAERLLALRQRVVGGYLYYAGGDDDAGAAEPIPTETEIETAFATRYRPAMEAALAPLEAEPAPELADALAAHDRVYRLYGELGQLLRRPRRALLAALRARGDADPDASAAELLAAPIAEGLERLLAEVAAGRARFEDLQAVAGPLSPAWDVAAPTYAETPEVLERAVAAQRTALPQPDALPAPDLPQPGALPAPDLPHLGAARAARRLGELDDRLYGRAQTLVRRALLALARRWNLSDPNDIFFLPLAEVRAAAGGEHPPPSPEEAQRRAGAARAARERQRAWAMPLAFRDGRPIQAAAGGGHGVWRGRGTGGRAEGPVVRIIDLTRAPEIPAGSVLVAATITPAMAVAAARASALIAEHGGLLGHGAAMARELGIPCVVGCTGALRALRDGERVFVDGAAGLVARRRETSAFSAG